MKVPRKRQNDGPDDLDRLSTATPDWDALEGADFAKETVQLPADPTFDEIEGEQPGELPGEDDDNPYQESDEALPDDREEAAISRDPDKSEGRFGKV